MVAEIICINKKNGSQEQLSERCETIRRGLAVLDITVPLVTTVDNDSDIIFETLNMVSSRCDMVLIANGLGEDSLAKDVLCRFLSVQPNRHEAARKHMVTQSAAMRFTPTPAWQSATELPDDCTLLPDPTGPFCAFSLQRQNRNYYVLPDRFSDIHVLLSEVLMPYLAQRANIYYVHNEFRIFGQDRTSLERILYKLESRYHCLSFLSESDGCLNVELSAIGNSENEALKNCNTAGFRLKNELGLNLFSVDGKSLSTVTVEALKRLKLTVATAESCTGGALSKEIIDIPGASVVLEMGICAYSDRIKEQVLGVPKDIIEQYGSVSKYAAMSMARGIHKISNATLGVAITGVAGPAPSEGKDVGTVYIALCDHTNIWIRSLHLPVYSTRDEVRRYATQVAMDLIRRYTAFYPQPMPGYYSESNPHSMTQQPQSRPTAAKPNFIPHTKKDVPLEDPEAFIFSSEDITDEELKRAADVAETPDTFLPFTLPDDDYLPPDMGPEGYIYGNNAPYTSDMALTPDDDYLPPDIGPDGYVYQSSADTAYQPDFSFPTDEEPENEALPESFVPLPDDVPAALSDESRTPDRLSFGARLLQKNVPAAPFTVQDEPPGAPDSSSAKPANDKAKWIVMIAVLSILVFLIGFLFYFFRDHHELQLIENARNTYYSGNTQTAMNELRNQNDDFAAWLSVEGSADLDLPVYQTNDNDYYITHNMARKKSKCGALYCSETALTSKQKNLCIYGKNMDNETMFGTLSDYLDINYLKDHSVITLQTFSGRQTYRVVNVLIVNTDAADDNGTLFGWIRSAFSSDDDFSEWKKELQLRSIYYAADLKMDQPLLALVTNSKEFDSARFVVLAQQIDPSDDTPHTYISNSSPKYPAAWYTKHGLSYPY